MDDEWEIPPITLEIESQLGEGAFGEVHKGVIRGPIPGSRTMKDCIGCVVAIKYLKGELQKIYVCPYKILRHSFIIFCGVRKG